MSTVVRTLVILVVTFSFTLLYGAQSSEYKLRVVTEDIYPMSYLDPETQKPAGYATDYLVQLLEEAKVEYSIDVLPWSRALNIASEESNVLIYAIARSSDREERFQWLKQILSLKTGLYSLKSRQASLNLNPETLKEAKIGVIRGDYTHLGLERLGYTKLIPTNDEIQLGNLLKKGRVDYICSTSEWLEFFEPRLDLKNDRLVSVFPIPELDLGIFYALSLKTPQTLYQHLKDAEKALTARGVRLITPHDPEE